MKPMSRAGHELWYADSEIQASVTRVAKGAGCKPVASASGVRVLPLAREGMSMDTSKVTRFEIIQGRAGRVLVRYGVSVELVLQDDGRTLKVFLPDLEDVRVADPQVHGLCERDEVHDPHLYDFAGGVASCPGQYSDCRNCDDRKCMACVSREIHDACAEDCPFCCAS